MKEPDEESQRQLRREIADAMAWKKHRCFVCFGQFPGLTPKKSRIIEQTVAFLS